MKVNNTSFFYLFTILFFILTIQTSSQVKNKILAGKVLDKSTGKSIPSVNIYVINSTIGTTTDINGFFALKNIKFNNIELIISSIGYKTVVKSIRFEVNDLKKNIYVELEPFAYELPEIDIEEDEDNEWQKMFKTFKTYFIGTGPNASQTEILNPYYINLKKVDNTLIASCQVPIQIENRALGYKLVYLLKLFELNKPNLRFSGVASFISLPIEDEKQSNRIIKNRFSTYSGSIHHFAKVVAKGYYNEKKLIENSVELPTKDSLFMLNQQYLSKYGFEVYQTDEIPSNEFKRQTAYDININDYIVDSKYADEFILTFKDYLLVKFYPRTFNYDLLATRGEEISYFTLERISVSFNPDYGVLDEEALIAIGKWSEKRISDMLPIDYDIPNSLVRDKDIF